jgi:hypothetical protein
VVGMQESLVPTSGAHIDIKRFMGKTLDLVALEHVSDVTGWAGLAAARGPADHAPANVAPSQIKTFEAARREARAKVFSVYLNKINRADPGGLGQKR